MWDSDVLDALWQALKKTLPFIYVFAFVKKVLSVQYK